MNAILGAPGGARAGVGPTCRLHGGFGAGPRSTSWAAGVITNPETSSGGFMAAARSAILIRLYFSGKK